MLVWRNYGFQWHLVISRLFVIYIIDIYIYIHIYIYIYIYIYHRSSTNVLASSKGDYCLHEILKYIMRQIIDLNKIKVK